MKPLPAEPTHGKPLSYVDESSVRRAGRRQCLWTSCVKTAMTPRH
jgi:hypothetical protein